MLAVAALIIGGPVAVWRSNAARQTVAEVLGIRDQIEMAHSQETLTRIDPSVPIFEVPIAAEELVDAAALARLVATARRFDPS